MRHVRRRCLAIAAAFMMLPGIANGEDCKTQNLSVSFEQITFVDPLPSFDLCVSAPLLGTLRGTVLSCVRFADIVPSDAIWHDGSADVSAAWWYDELRTPDGTITITERGMIDGKTGLQATMMQVTGGTGPYANASGLLTTSPEWPNRLAGLAIRGVICTP